MNTSTKTTTSKEIALTILNRNTSRIEKIHNQVREDMNKPKFINMDEDRYEREWNQRIEALTLDNSFN